MDEENLSKRDPLIPISFNKIIQSPSYTALILSSYEKKFAIYTEPSIGIALQLYLSDTLKQRPSTYDLIERMFKGFDISILKVIINDVEDTTYFAKLFLECQKGPLKEVLEIDARPSDCLVLATIHKAPLYCRKETLEKAVPIQD